VEAATSHFPSAAITGGATIPPTTGGVGVPPTTGPVGILPTESIDSTFFADIPLDETGAPTPVTFSFESGALVMEKSITWASADLSLLDEIHIRQGDSLRLVATKTPGPPETSNFGTYSVTLDGVPLPAAAGGPNHQPGQPFPVTFTEPGIKQLAVTYHGNKPPRTVTVTVHAADFGPAIAARAHFAREWQPPLIGPDAIVEPDSAIAWRETTASPPPGEGQGEGAPPARSFHLNSAVAGSRHVIARLPDDLVGAPGAILARGTVHTFYLAYLDETDDIVVAFTYPDGTRLMRGSIVAVGLPPDVAIRLNTYYQGTVFANGGNILWLTAADFGQNGVADIWFEWAGQGDPYVCTFVDLFTTHPPPPNP
jgi:hypothetical protein